jgi:hypothetical protein
LATKWWNPLSLTDLYPFAQQEQKKGINTRTFGFGLLIEFFIVLKFFGLITLINFHSRKSTPGQVRKPVWIYELDVL